MMQDTTFHYLRYPWGVSFTGMLLVAGPAGGVLVDTALPEAVDGFLLPQFRHFGFSLSALRLVINTHHHEDHAGGNARLRKLCGDDYVNVKKALRDDNGRIPFEKVGEFVQQLIEALNPNS